MSVVQINGYGDDLTVNGVRIGDLTPDEHESIEKNKGGQNYSPLENIVVSKVKDSSTLLARRPHPDDIKKYIETELIDGLCCYSAVNQGQLNKTIVDSVIKHLDEEKLPTVPRSIRHKYMSAFLLAATSITEMDKVVPKVAGVESWELSFKISRRWGHYKKGIPEKDIIIVGATGNFHGRSMAAISTSNSNKMKEGFGPLIPGFKSIAFNDKSALFENITDKTAAVIVEPIQGEGGINVVPDHTLSLLRKLCDEHGALLIFDEVQCGVGRTGKLFAHEWSGIFPDIMTIAKGIGGGIPLGACLASNSAALGMGLGSHGSTYGGNPLACAVGIEVLNQVLEMDFLPNVRRIAGQWFQKLSGLVDEYEKVFAEVKGMGLMLGLKTKVNNQLFIEEAFKNNLLLVPAADNTVRLLPPLNINKSEVDLVIKLLKKSAEGLIK